MVASAILALWCRSYFGSDWFEVAAFITGVGAVYLSAREHVLNWPIGIVNVLIYAYVFYVANLKADMMLQLVYLVLCIHGWHSWLKGGEQKTELKISRLNTVSWLLVVAVIAIGTAVYKPLIEYLKGASPFWDTLLTVTSLCAQFLLNRKYLENWILWIFVNIIYVPLYISRDLYATAILYGIFLILAILGLVTWSKRTRPQIEFRPSA